MVIDQRLCSNRKLSECVCRFVARTAGEHSAPEGALGALIESARPKRRLAQDQLLQHLLRERNITRVELVPGLQCDGMIEPIGRGFADGFVMRLNKSVSTVRQRFTMAHELCHTYFYELVPELKFVPHSTDADEERLCNWGAAAVLIPSGSLRRRAEGLPVNLETLDILAQEYGVSVATMILRLREIGLWMTEMSHWRLMADGSFALDKLYGASGRDWLWEDASVLIAARETNVPIFGRTFISFNDDKGIRRYRPIAYELRRAAGGIVALWGPRLTASTPELPLWNVKSQRRA